MRPKSIEDLSCVIAGIRPGVLESKMADAYVRRRNGEEEATTGIHPALDEILKDTYACLWYQEQSIKIAQEIAGYSEVDADSLRKAIGKKLPEEMAKQKLMFAEGAAKKGTVTKEQAVEIFGWIEKSQRYSFNKCVTPDTVVETESGYKTIENLNIGEKVNSPNGFVEVKDKFSTGEQEVFEITLESGKTIKCTMNHKFLCSNGEVKKLYNILLENLEIVCED